MAGEPVSRLAAKVALLAQTADEALAEARELARRRPADGAHYWLGGLTEALERIQLDCADAGFAVRELRQTARQIDGVQPRLF